MSDSAPDPVALAAQVADLAAQAQALGAREAALAEREAAAAAQAEGLRRAQAIAFCDSLADAARIRPADVPALAELVLRLDAEAPAPCFAAPDSPEAPIAPGAWLRGWLGQLPPLVELGQVATSRRAGQTPGGISDAEAARRARAYKAKQTASGQPISFTEACAAVDRNLDQAPE